MSLNYFDAITYINLRHRKDRNSHILKELHRLNVDKNKIKRFEGHYIPFNGHLGCVLSHLDIINWAFQANLNNVLILEDDCYFIDNVEFLDMTIEYFFKMVKKWDVFLLGGYYEKFEKTHYRYINKIKESYRSHAYALNKNYYTILKNNFLSTVEVLNKHNFHFEGKKIALDQRWQPLQKRDLWYASNILLTAQIADYSDIGWKNKENR